MRIFIPTQENLQTVIDNLIKANEVAEKSFAHLANVDMSHGYIDTVCGTPMCHGGWYAFIASGVSAEKLEELDYMDGANLMAKHLGFDFDQGALEEWAENNPDIWGNLNGGDMFGSSKAFEIEGDCLYLETIINHWKGVKERCAIAETMITKYYITISGASPTKEDLAKRLEDIAAKLRAGEDADPDLKWYLENE